MVTNLLPPLTDRGSIVRIAWGVALYDVSIRLPKRGPRTRPLSSIRRIYVHHSGRLGKPGFEGALNSTRYVMQQRTPRFRCAAYHYWIPAEPVRDEASNLVLFRLVPDHVRAWHTGSRANTHGLGIALQGNTTTRELTESHVECLEALLPWLRERYADQLADTWLSWHSDAGQYGGKPKKACPGKHAEQWLKAYRELS